jgi:hypothetical protein
LGLFPNVALPSHIALGSLPLSRFMLARVCRPNERVRPGLNRIRKFFEILAHVAQVIEQLIDIVGVYVKCLIEAPG